MISGLKPSLMDWHRIISEAHQMSPQSLLKNSVEPLRRLILRLNGSGDVPPVTCILSDGVMGFALKVAEELGIPDIVFFTPSACGLLGYMHYEKLVEKGYVPLKDESCLTNGYLDTKIDWIPAMHGIRLKDLPTYLRTTDPNDIMFNYNIDCVNISYKAKGVIINTFDDLEQDVLAVIKSKYPQIYTVGPLSTLCGQIPVTETKFIESNLWEKDMSCLEWLEGREPRSVLYVNFGSLATLTSQQLDEFAWGLANCKYPFVWIIRSDLVNGASTEIVSDEFKEEIKGRGLVLGWCSQEDVLRHESIGGFLTHCGWNSTIESISEGVPMTCWPFFVDQQTNCFYICNRWGIGMEINHDIKREDIEEMVKELMEGDKGEEMRKKSMELKKKAMTATNPGGTSYTNFEMLIEDVAGFGQHSKVDLTAPTV